MIFRRKKKPKELYAIEELMPPEGVPLKLQIAGIGVRMGAQIADILITLVGCIALFVLVFSLGFVSPQTMTAVGAMLFFFVRIPYYVLSEIAWNGQTLGKKMMKIKVISVDGQSLSIHALVVRNLLKEAEVFLPGTLLLTLDSNAPGLSLIAFAWVLGALLVPVFNSRRRRLGDLVAGTYVIHLPQPILLRDIAQAEKAPTAKQSEFRFMSHHLDHYGAYELQTLEDMLRRQYVNLNADGHSRRNETTAKVVENIRLKINYAASVPPEDHFKFLQAFYNAQRAYLEQRQLFGERRSDKHHAAPGDDA